MAIFTDQCLKHIPSQSCRVRISVGYNMTNLPSQNICRLDDKLAGSVYGYRQRTGIATITSRRHDATSFPMLSLLVWLSVSACPLTHVFLFLTHYFLPPPSHPQSNTYKPTSTITDIKQANKYCNKLPNCSCLTTHQKRFEHQEFCSIMVYCKIIITISTLLYLL